MAVGAADNFDGRSVALVDLWNRGVLDVVSQIKRPVAYLQEHYWNRKRVGRLRTGSSTSNRSAIGAQ